MNKLFTVFTFVFALSFIAGLNANAQDAPISTGLAPYVYNTAPQSVLFDNPLPNSRGFSVDAISISSSQVFKYFLGTPGTSQNVGTASANFLGSGDFGGPSNLLYMISQISPYVLYSVDTSTGVRTTVGTITGINAGHSAGGITGCAWDATTNTMYLTSTAITSSALYTLNLSTQVATQVGGLITNAPGIIALGCSNTGLLFAIDIVNDNLWSLNKTTGAATLVGALGYNANYGQDCDFDPHDDVLYWAAIGTGTTQLRTINTATGASTLVGLFTGKNQVLATGIPGAGTTYTHDYAAGPFLSLPVQFIKTTPYNIKAKITNQGTSPETSVPIAFFVNGAQQTSVNLSLAAGANDSVSYTWTPATAGAYNLKWISRLGTDENKSNDTVQTNVTVLNAAPIFACIGTGTLSSNYPFTTYWHDGRTQMLFTSTELLAQGLLANYEITKLGFNVITAAPQLMNGFNVRYQLTTQTSLTGFVTSGTWFTGYTGTYSVPGTGWQYIDMSTPYFAYDGTSNLLVEVCYDNTSYTSYSTVNATSTPGMTWGYYTDGLAGCTMTGGTAQANRPNVCFEIQSPVGITQNGNNIPTEYALSQNYPNPFNPTTNIKFDLPKQGFVSLKVYDVVGKEVATLVNEVKSAGSYIVGFNGTELSSGVYFYRLESGIFVENKRMVLIK